MNADPRYRLLVLAFAGIFFMKTPMSAQESLQILPLGNSITYDDNSLDKTDPRPEGDRIAYRYTLYQLLQDAGYDFDYIGSENGGLNYFIDAEYDDNAGFPGIETFQLTNLIATGYNPLTDTWLTPGPYLNYFPPDIILLHIGTNNLIESASDVELLLDTIRFFNPDCLILLAKIINRQTYHQETTNFNNNVESMVNSRGDDRIILVDMESGAGIDYATEMADNLHPNPDGFNKMAGQWFEAIDNLNQAPVIDDIPVQLYRFGTPFTDLDLDEYVDDQEDADAILSWSFKQQAESHLDISIDGSRVMHVTPNEGWRGSETITLKVEDSGSGIIRKRDSIEVTFAVNDPPVITSSPPLSEPHIGEEFQYVITATDADPLETLEYDAIRIPEWLGFSALSDSAILEGTATENDIGTDTIILMVSDGYYEVSQEFTLRVLFPAGTLVTPVQAKRIYPNPVHDELVIRNEGERSLSIAIFSLNGQLVYRTELEGSSPRLDLGSLRKGIYFIIIRSDEGVTRRKFVKI